MLGTIKNFVRSEDGAVTVDWVVLTAAVAGLCIGLLLELRDETTGLSSLTQDYLENQEPAGFGAQE